MVLITGVGTIYSIDLPVVTPSANAANTFTLGGSSVAVDSGVTVTSSEADLTDATVTINDYQSGDTLDFTNQNGITGSYAGGVLTLSGSATPTQYQTALQSVTFSTTSTEVTARSLAIVVADNSLASNSAAEQVDIYAPDLEITTTDDLGGSSASDIVGTAVPGDGITYTIVVTNAGASGVTGASVTDALPSALTGATYTAQQTGGATGFTAIGSGSIDDTDVDLPAGSTVTYTVVATINPAATGTLSNTATVAASAAAVNASLVSSLSGPYGAAVSGGTCLSRTSTMAQSASTAR